MSQRMGRMAGSYVLWLTLASCILTLASTEQPGEYSAHVAAAHVTRGEAWGREGGTQLMACLGSIKGMQERIQE